MRGELGGEYVDALRQLYDGRVPGGADLVRFGSSDRANRLLLAKRNASVYWRLNSISMVGNRPVLENILKSGGIFMAWSDSTVDPDGAAVRVAMIGFDDGSQRNRTLDGVPVFVLTPT